MSAVLVRPRSRIFLFVICGLALVLVAASASMAWWFSNQMVKPVHGPATFPETVDEVRSTPDGKVVVSLARTPGSARAGRWGLVWPGGNALLSPAINQAPHTVDRVLLSGSHPMSGMKASMSWTYGSDPQVAFGLSFSEITVNTDLGPAPAWYIPSDAESKTGSAGGTWVITVHGSNADRRQFLRFVPGPPSGGPVDPGHHVSPRTGSAGFARWPDAFGSIGVA